MSQNEYRIHPLVYRAQDQLAEGRINRREFMRYATLLGTSVATASVLAACAPEAAPAPDTGDAAPGAGMEEEPSAATIQRGGTMRIAMQLQLLDHPARLSWVQGANIVRQTNEYLTETGPDNITRPYLLDRWEASDDVQTWTLHLKEGVTFNNGDELTAEDVMFTFEQWLDENVDSSMLGLLTYLDGMNSVTMVDDYTIRLDLEAPNIGVPEHLFHYPAVILHRGFEGDIVQQPVGTGAFLLEEYAEGERAVFSRRDDYWRLGEDGDPLPYLDELIFVSIDKDTAVAGMQSDQVDSMYQPRPSDWQALRDHPDLTVRSASTAQCFVLRMRVDLEPWNDNRVRTALKKCQDREQILQLSYFGEGDLSIDAHVAPVHPAYAPKPILEYDPEGALELMEEWAAENDVELPLTVTLATKNDQSEPEMAQALVELARPGGFNIELDITEPTGFWDRWTEVPLGITAWTHRSLDTMVLPLAYITDENGDPVPWNETRWSDEEFTTLLREAERTLDVEARREIMSDIEDIMQERGPIGNSYWNNVWNITRSEFQNIVAHPTDYYLLYEVWIDE